MINTILSTKEIKKIAKTAVSESKKAGLDLEKTLTIWESGVLQSATLADANNVCLEIIKIWYKK